MAKYMTWVFEQAFIIFIKMANGWKIGKYALIIVNEKTLQVKDNIIGHKGRSETEIERQNIEWM